MRTLSMRAERLNKAESHWKSKSVVGHEISTSFVFYYTLSSHDRSKDNMMRKCTDSMAVKIQAAIVSFN